MRTILLNEDMKIQAFRFSLIHVPAQAGYTPLMLAAAHQVEVGEHRGVIQHLIERGGVNSIAQQVGGHITFVCTREDVYVTE